MAKKTESTSTPTTVAPWAPDVEQNTAALVLHGRALALTVAGNRRMQISLDSVELGVNEISLELPGIQLRIGL